MSIKLNDTQLMLLSSAAQRKDRCLTLPSVARLVPARKAVNKLLDAGFVREIRARGDAPVWRRDEETGEAYTLKLAASGAKAIAVEVEAARDDTDGSASAEGDTGGAASAAAASPETVSPAELGAEPLRTVAAAIHGEPRPGTKTAGVIAMLSLESGATVDQLAAAMGWLPHTTRAALTGLRKRGYLIERLRRDEGKAASYRLTVPVEG
jgi:hypothetical protein